MSAVAPIKGFALPFKFGELGHANRATGREKLKANLRAIIYTAVGERIMLPAFGTVGMEMLFRKLDSPALVLLSGMVREAIGRFEPRVRVLETTTQVDPEGGTLHVTIQYAIRASGQFDDLTVAVAED